MLIDLVAACDLQELKEQFSDYRREKGQNEAIVREQMETLRQEASALRMESVKITAKVSCVQCVRDVRLVTVVRVCDVHVHVHVHCTYVHVHVYVTVVHL